MPAARGGGWCAEGRADGDYQLLIIKLALDVFTALIFSITLGAAVISIAVVNFLPALLFIIPLSIYWHRWFG